LKTCCAAGVSETTAVSVTAVWEVNVDATASDAEAVSDAMGLNVLDATDTESEALAVSETVVANT
jgi:hypothetical protein